MVVCLALNAFKEKREEEHANGEPTQKGLKVKAKKPTKEDKRRAKGQSDGVLGEEGRWSGVAP